MPAIPPRLAACAQPEHAAYLFGQPDRENPADYYTNAITNHYARLVQAIAIDGRGYAFPYDHVVSPAGADQSRAVVDPAPSLLTVTLGPAH